MKYNLLLTIICFSICAFGQQTPAPKQSKTIVIGNGTAHIGNGKVIENSVIVIKDGKITQIGNISKIPLGQFKNTKIYNAKGKDIYPGFIAPNTTLGLAEIDAVRATIDEKEIGSFLPHIRSIIAYNAESKIVESMRPNGVLIGQVTPRGGVISGTSSIVQFDAWNWEDAIVKEDDGLHLNWPSNFKKTGYWFDPDRRYEINKNYTNQLNNLQEFFTKSKAYHQSNQSKNNIVYEAMKGVFEGTKRLFVHIQAEKEIVDLITFKKKYLLEKVVIVGGAETYKVAEQLKNNNISVLLQRVHSLPKLEGEAYDLPYRLPKMLHDKGVLVGLETSGDMERMNTRNLPFYAGTSVGYGLDKEDALKLITLHTAKILGIDQQVGSLEVGKDATLFISKGDALDMQNNRLTHAFINGREISLETHQTQLYQRYTKKLNQKEDD